MSYFRLFFCHTYVLCFQRRSADTNEGRCHYLLQKENMRWIIIQAPAKLIDHKKMIGKAVLETDLFLLSLDALWF